MRIRRRERFVCRTCGGTHEGLPTDCGSLLPELVWNAGPEVRDACLSWSTDLCFHEGRWYLRGVLEVPFTFQPGRWGWGVWAEVSEETIARFRAVFGTDGSHLPRESGVLANPIAAYEDTLGLPLEIQFIQADKRPLLYLPEGVDHPLAHDQRNGYDDARYHAILALYAPRNA